MAANMFLKLTGIDGESTIADHEKEIEVLSFSSSVLQAASPQSTSGSATSSNASFSDLTLTKYMDSASPTLFKTACTGKPIDQAVLCVTRSDSDHHTTYLKYTLQNVVLSNYQASGSDGGGLPIESLGLNFGTFQIEYSPTDRASGGTTGAVTAGWDVTANKSL